MKVLIATKNKGKVEGAKRAFDKFFEDVEVVGISAESNVPEQPVNEETWNGAKNRVENLKKIAKERGIDADYYVAAESGIQDYFDEWMITAVAGIEDNNGLIRLWYSMANSNCSLS